MAAEGWPAEAPDPGLAWYELFRMKGDRIFAMAEDRELTEEQVAARFEEKWGYPPEWIIACGRFLRVGPAGVI